MRISKRVASARENGFATHPYFDVRPSATHCRVSLPPGVVAVAVVIEQVYVADGARLGGYRA